MRDIEREILLEEQERKNQKADAMLAAIGRGLEQLALLLTGAGIVCVLLAAKGADPDLFTGAAVSFALGMIFSAFGGWIGGDENA